MLKRFVDILFSLVALILASPTLVVVAAAVKLGDGGPVFFRQVRVGQFGKQFRILKFRSMTVDAPNRGPEITAATDRRVTQVGRIIRKTKLDELPQLWNVLIGEMSLVGPRPEVPQYVAGYTPEQARVLELKPGITDEASIVFRDEESVLAAADDPHRFYIEHCVPQKIAINLSYAANASVWRDIGIILRTIAAVWIHRK